jgi:transcriptional regulator with GAF, ATPase, and Fis domain
LRLVREQLAKDHGRGSPVERAFAAGADRRRNRHGQDAIARWIHRNGPRADERAGRDSIARPCPMSLAEAELFGHERGAFTDAKAARIGLMEAADGEHCFSTNCRVSRSASKQTAHGARDHMLRRVGASRAIPVDARIIAATNADLRPRGRGKISRETSCIDWIFFRVRCRH